MCKSKQRRGLWAANHINIKSLSDTTWWGRLQKISLAITLLGSAQLQRPVYGQFLDMDALIGGVRTNQIGFGIHAPKIAVLDHYIFSGQQRPMFYVIALSQTPDTVYKGRMYPSQPDLYSHQPNYIADFTDLSKAGHFYLEIPGQGQSFPFIIAKTPYTPLLAALNKAFYFNRASTEIPDKYGGPWARKAGHPDNNVLIHRSAASAKKPAGTFISAPGGWYDDADYNKSIVSSAFTMNTLLTALMEYPTQFNHLSLDIPSSGEQLPDYVRELLYNLRWMLRMQDPDDGGVYHKLTSAGLSKLQMPEKDRTQRYVVQKSITATLDFAAVMARAALALAPYTKALPGLEDSLKSAVSKAWDWAFTHPEARYQQDLMNKKFKPKITTGGYEDQSATDEWYQAAISLLLLFKDNRYLATITATAPLVSTLKTPSWSEVAALGAFWLSELPDSTVDDLPGWQEAQKQTLKDLKQQASLSIINKAKALADHMNPGFLTVMGADASDYRWGSNGHAAAEGQLLMEAFRLTKDPLFKRAALSNLDYLLGRNPTGYSFVTGMGSTTPMNPHHKVSMSDDQTSPVPGFLVGGPNLTGEDHIKKYDPRRPDLAYTDDQRAYSVNDVAITWNASLIYLIAALQACGL